MNHRNINNQSAKCKGYSNARIRTLSGKNKPQLYSMYFQDVQKQTKPIDTVSEKI